MLYLFSSFPSIQMPHTASNPYKELKQYLESSLEHVDNGVASWRVSNCLS